jgi:hypothetical protein
MEITEEIIEKSDLTSKGQYTSVGTYEDSEMLSLVQQLHLKTKIEIPQLLREFGHYLFNSFAKKYQHLIGHINDSFDMLRKIDNYIHIEVKKIYTHTQLPTFSYEDISKNQLKLIYNSERKMPDLAQGLIEGTLEYFDDDFFIEQEILNKDLSSVAFFITRK